MRMSCSEHCPAPLSYDDRSLRPKSSKSCSVSGKDLQPSYSHQAIAGIKLESDVRQQQHEINVGPSKARLNRLM